MKSCQRGLFWSTRDLMPRRAGCWGGDQLGTGALEVTSLSGHLRPRPLVPSCLSNLAGVQGVLALEGHPALLPLQQPGSRQWLDTSESTSLMLSFRPL